MTDKANNFQDLRVGLFLTSFSYYFDSEEKFFKFGCIKKTPSKVLHTVSFSSFLFAKFNFLFLTKFLSPQRVTNEVNPLSANSDQQQVSPNNIHTLSRDKVMRINKMITIEKML